MNRDPICSICGKGLDIFDRQQKFQMNVSRIGYGSIHEGREFHLKMCSKCFDKFVQNTHFLDDPFKTLDVAVWVRNENSPYEDYTLTTISKEKE